MLASDSQTASTLTGQVIRAGQTRVKAVETIRGYPVNTVGAGAEGVVKDILSRGVKVNQDVKKIPTYVVEFDRDPRKRPMSPIRQHLSRDQFSII